MSILSGILSGAKASETITQQIDRPDKATRKEKARTTAPCIRFKTIERAKKELGILKLSPAVRKFGQFMLEQSARDITPRDAVKAYTVTLSSIQRQAITPEGLRKKSWPDHPFTEPVLRPEDVFAYLLKSPDGQLYLDSAETGTLSPEALAAAERIVSKFAGFGLENSFRKVLTVYAPRLAAVSAEMARVLRTGSKDDWYEFAVEYLWGIDHAKKGFIASLLGRGDMPTADTRQVKFWWVNRGSFTRKQREGRMGKFAKQLESRLEALNVKMPKELQPFYQHLAHHALWDAVGGTETTHADVVDCMRFAGL